MRKLLSITTVLSLLLIVASCGFNNAQKARDKAKRKEVKKAREKKKADAIKAAEASKEKAQKSKKNSDTKVDAVVTEYEVWTDVVNVLNDGKESAGATKRYAVNLNDNVKKTILSKNSKLSVEMISHNGTILFQVRDLVNDVVLTKETENKALAYLTLGRDRITTIKPELSEGFVMVRALVTAEVDEQTIEEMNQLISKREKIEQKLLSKDKSEEEKKELEKELEKVVQEIRNLDQKIEKEKK